MATNPDVLAAVQDEIQPDLIEQFETANPLWEKLFNKPTRQAKGPRQTFVVNTGGPGTAQKLSTGREPGPGTAHENNAYRGGVTPTRIRYTYEVTGKEMAEIRDADGVNDLIDQYPVAAMGEIIQGASAQMLRAASSAGTSLAKFDGLDGITTMNGNQTTAPDNVVTDNGVFLFDAEANQTAVVHGLESAGGAGTPVPGWANQYIEINNSTQLYTAVRALQRKAAQLGRALKKPDIGFCDELTYQNLISQLEKYVRIPMVKGDVVDKKILERGGLAFHQGLVIYEDINMDITDTVAWGTAASGAAISDLGVLYMLCSNDWEIVGHASKQDGGNGYWEFKALGQIPRSDIYEYQILAHFALYTTNRRNQGVLVGGAEGAIAL